MSHCLEEDWLHSAMVETHLPLLEMLIPLAQRRGPLQTDAESVPNPARDVAGPAPEAPHPRPTSTARCGSVGRKSSGVTSPGCASRGEVRGPTPPSPNLFVDEWQGDLISAYADLRDSGHLELTASAATHGLLPLLMRVPESVQAQVRAGIRQYVQCFGRMPRGFWLPECAYAPALSQVLKQEGIDWTIVEEHGLTTAPQADEEVPFNPGMTSDGLMIFGRDQASSSEIWNADEGFPGDERYRDFMRDIGLEAPIEYLREYLGESGQRQFTGLKYFRSSRDGNDSEIYDPELASRALEEHSVRFISSRGAQLAGLEGEGVENPIVVCAFDADLFGHWWYEGTEFLERVFRKAAKRTDFFFTTPGAYLVRKQGTGLPSAAPGVILMGRGRLFRDLDEHRKQLGVSGVAEAIGTISPLREHLRRESHRHAGKRVTHRQRCIQLMTKELLLGPIQRLGISDEK